MKDLKMMTLRTLTILLATATFTLGLAGTASADYLPEDGAARERIDSLELVEEFLASDQFILSRLELRKMSADVVADLLTVSHGKRYNTKMRSRAIQSLSLYARDDDRASLGLKALLKKIKPGHKLCPTVIVAYAEALGEDAVADIQSFATHKRADVRMAAVIAMGRYGGQAGYDLLKELKGSEKHKGVLKRIGSYVD